MQRGEIMENRIVLYHGSEREVSKPNLKAGKENNDYGRGFYCTMQYDLACEWASKHKGLEGFVNKYELDLDGLRILDLTSKKYNILHWMTLLLQHRTFALMNPISVEARTYLRAHFSIPLQGYDLIKGYRADDSYFSFAEDFLNNTISVQHLAKAMKLGDLGIQYVLISSKAFKQLNYLGAEQVDNQIYYPRYNSRDVEARNKYKRSKINLSVASNELYVLDILRGGIIDGDPRIP